MRETIVEELKSLKKDFKQIVEIHENIESYHSHVSHKLSVLKSEYTVFRKTNKASLHVFCLDSIHFQLRLYKNYFDDYIKSYKMINNHIYRDYYKLYKLMREYLDTHISDKKMTVYTENHNFPVYKDLEVLETYELSTVHELHDAVLLMIQGLYELCVSKESVFPHHTTLIERGYDLHNLHSSIKFNNSLIESHIRLYIDLLTFFKIQKMKYLNEHYNKIHQLYYELPPVNNFDGKSPQQNDMDRLANMMRSEGELHPQKECTITNVHVPKDDLPDTISVSSIVEKLNRNTSEPNYINKESHELNVVVKRSDESVSTLGVHDIQEDNDSHFDNDDDVNLPVRHRSSSRRSLTNDDGGSHSYSKVQNLSPLSKSLQSEGDNITNEIQGDISIDEEKDDNANENEAVTCDNEPNPDTEIHDGDDTEAEMTKEENGSEQEESNEKTNT